MQEVRGVGMLSGIEFTSPRHLKLRIPFETFLRIHPGIFRQVLVMRLFRHHGILTQMCGNIMVLKVAPPLMVTEAKIAEFVSATHDVVELMQSSSVFWSEALGLARRVINI